MFRYQFDVAKVKKKIAQIYSNFRKTGLEILSDTIESIASDMREPGSPSVSPVKWDSEKQRRAFFASDGFGGGIPHVRKGDYIAGYKVSTLPNGFSLTNDRPGAAAVGGWLKGSSLSTATAVQSKIYANRWKNVLITIRSNIAGLPKRVADKMKTIIGRNG